MEVNYAELYAKAIEENGGNSTVVPDGPYRVKVGSVKRGQSNKNAKPQVGLRLVVLDGAYEGTSTWVNQTFTADNPAAVAIFLRIMVSLGVPQEAIAAGMAPAQLADYIVIGSEGVAELSHHMWDNTARQDLKSFQLQSTPAAQPQQPVIQTPVQQVPQQAVPVQVQPVQQVPAPPVQVQQQPVQQVAVGGQPPF